jgi:hypothetical protein
VALYSYAVQVGFALRSTGHGKRVVAPEEVGTEVLKYLLRITADFMGHDQVSLLWWSETCIL